MSIEVQKLLSVDGAIARRLDGFEARPQQVEMAATIERTLDRKERLVIEAGTGVGKSFAYLIPAIKRIVEHSERVVIATHTINLQEQLAEKDIPLLNAVIPDEFSAVLVKGRGNYVSLRRLKLASERQDRLFRDDDARHSLHTIEDWAYSTHDGSRATLPQLSRPEVWDYAQSDTHNCMSKKCPTFKQCFYQAARRRMENGDLLICNHALFFADLALRHQGVGFLPTYDHVILDEAHNVEDVASDHFGATLGQGRITHLLNLLYHPASGKGFLQSVKLKDESRELIDRTIECTLVCRNRADDLFDALWRWQRDSGPRNGRISEPGIIENNLSTEMKKLAELMKLLRRNVPKEADEFELNSYINRASEIADSAEMLIDQKIEGCVYWLDTHQPQRSNQTTGSRRGAFRRVSLHCAPIEVGPILAERLFDQEVSVVMTSATLATAPDDFSHITASLGCPDAESIQLGSPFDHAAQMVVKVDRTMPQPVSPKYVQELCPRLIRHIRDTDGGAFVLFTSFKMLDQVAQELRDELARDGYPLLVHGTDGPPGQLLRRFRHDQRSVLLGTVSFWQGVDVRGKGLRNVIIIRLPFDVPDRPLIEARHERIRERGDNPFVEDQLPRAILRFKQGVGRLIRSTTDEGQIVVLDPRIATKSYGRLFLRALPEGVKIETIEIVNDVAQEA